MIFIFHDFINQKMIYDKHYLKNFLDQQNSKLIKANEYPLKQKTTVYFTCIYCQKDCSKSWKALNRKIPGSKTAYCKQCARIVANKTHKETTKKKKIEIAKTKTDRFDNRPRQRKIL